MFAGVTMSIISKALAGLLILSIGACGYFAYTASVRGARVEEVQASNRELKTALEAATQVRTADAAAGSARAAATVVTQKRKVLKDAELKAAVQATPDWADSMVPPDVVNALRM